MAAKQGRKEGRVIWPGGVAGWKRVGSPALSIGVLATPTVNIPPLTNPLGVSVGGGRPAETRELSRTKDRGTRRGATRPGGGG